jgi:hypothetical protein
VHEYRYIKSLQKMPEIAKRGKGEGEGEREWVKRGRKAGYGHKKDTKHGFGRGRGYLRGRTTCCLWGWGGWGEDAGAVVDS